MTTTPVFNIVLPDPGASEDQWAFILNDGIVALEAALVEYADSIAGGITEAEADARYVQSAGDTMTGDLRLSSGAANNPSLTFSADQTNGLYHISTGVMGFATANAERMRLSSSALALAVPITAPRGTAPSPTLRFSPDINTGIFSPGADQVAVAIGASEAFRFASPSHVSGSPILLPGSPTLDLHAATKSYVDNAVTTGALRGVPWLWGPMTQAAPGLGYINVFVVAGGGGLDRELRLSEADADGNPRSAAFLLPGDTIVISTSPTAFGRYVVTAAPTQGAGFWLVLARRTDTTGSTAPPALNTRVTVTGTLASAGGEALTQADADARYVNLSGDTMTGALSLPAGTSIAPSLMLGDTNSGFYGGADVMNITLNSTNRFTLSSTLLALVTTVRVTNGSAVAPAYSFNGDTNTGMYWIGGDILGFSTNGTERLRITDGQIGINGVPINATSTVTMRAPDTTVVGVDVLDLLNANTAADSHVGINLRTANGAFRAALRGERPGSTNNGDLGIWTGTGGIAARAATFRANGNLDVVGDITARGVAVPSSASIKEGVIDAPSALASVNALRVVTFTRTPPPAPAPLPSDDTEAPLPEPPATRTETGFIAEEVQDVLPSAVTPQADAIFLMDMVATLTKAVQELTAKVAALEAA